MSITPLNGWGVVEALVTVGDAQAIAPNMGLAVAVTAPSDSGVRVTRIKATVMPDPANAGYNIFPSWRVFAINTPLPPDVSAFQVLSDAGFFPAALAASVSGTILWDDYITIPDATLSDDGESFDVCNESFPDGGPSVPSNGYLTVVFVPLEFTVGSPTADSVLMRLQVWGTRADPSVGVYSGAASLPRFDIDTTAAASGRRRQ